MIVYKAVNKLNGNTYIGKTVKPLKYRKSGHINSALKRNNNTYFCKAIRKYGVDNFEWSIIQVCITENHLSLAEQAYIELYKMRGIKLYNMTEGGEGSVGYKPSEETIEKFRILNSGKNNNMYGRRGYLAPSYGKPGTMLGKKHTEESKEKTRQSLKGRIFSEEHRKKLSLSGMNRKISNESKLKMSISRKGEKNHLYGKYGSDHHSSIAVYQIDKDTNETIKEWGSMRLAERELKIRHISECCKNKKKTAGGFKWAFVKNYPL